MQNENRLRELNDSLKYHAIPIIGVPEEEERKGQKIHLKK